MNATSSAVTDAARIPKLMVQRDMEQFQLQPGQDLRPGDVIRNTSTEAASVSAVSRNSAFSSQAAMLPPNSSVRVTERGEATDEVMGLEAVSGDPVIADVTAEQTAEADYTITPEVTETAGLFGAAPLFGGLLGPAAAALGLAALAAGSDSDSGSDGGGGAGGGGGNGSGGNGSGGNGGGGDVTPAGLLRNGAAGLADSVSAGLNDTPLAPASALTDALADGTNQVADQIVNLADQDPTGVAQLLAGALGFTQPGQDNDSSGVTGAVDALSAGLNDATAGTPLAGLVEPLGDVLAGSPTDLGGVASGLADLASALPTGDTPLAPLFDQLLTPVLGPQPAGEGGVGALPALPGLDVLGGGALPAFPGLDALSGLAGVAGGANALPALPDGADLLGAAGASPVSTLTDLAQVLAAAQPTPLPV